MVWQTDGRDKTLSKGTSYGVVTAKELRNDMRGMKLGRSDNIGRERERLRDNEVEQALMITACKM